MGCGFSDSSGKYECCIPSFDKFHKELYAPATNTKESNATNTKMTVLSTVRSIRDRFDGAADEFIASFVSGPVYVTSPMHQFVLRMTLPRSTALSADSETTSDPAFD